MRQRSSIADPPVSGVPSYRRHIASRKSPPIIAASHRHPSGKLSSPGRPGPGGGGGGGPYRLEADSGRGLVPVFRNPDRVDIARTEAAHLTFGYGTHYCIGAALARIKPKMVFTQLIP